MARRQHNDGKDLEGAVHTALHSLSTSLQSICIRLYDTTSARGQILPETYGDYLWILRGTPILVECKSTETGKPILELATATKKSKRQLSKHLEWNQKGNPSLYIWGDNINRTVIAYSGISVVERSPKPLSVGTYSSLSGVFVEALKGIR